MPYGIVITRLPGRAASSLVVVCSDLYNYNQLRHTEVNRSKVKVIEHHKAYTQCHLSSGL